MMKLMMNLEEIEMEDEAGCGGWPSQLHHPTAVTRGNGQVRDYKLSRPDKSSESVHKRAENYYRLLRLARGHLRGIRQ